MKKHRLRFLEAALAFGLMTSLIVGAYACRTQQELASKLLRLHVVANSDSHEDQALKLKVRDRVILTAQEYLEGVDDIHQAQRIISEHLPELESAAADEVRRHGFSYPVKATVSNMYFPTRDYETFSLPAGYYDAFRVEIGDARGQNWWCVMFPPLCITAAQVQESADDYRLTDEEVQLITSGKTVYRCKFKAVELFSEFCSLFAK